MSRENLFVFHSLQLPEIISKNILWNGYVWSDSFVASKVFGLHGQREQLMSVSTVCSHCEPVKVFSG